MCRCVENFFLTTKYVGDIISLFGGVAQLVERCVRNAEVKGSNPSVSTIKMKTVSVRILFLFLLWIAVWFEPRVCASKLIFRASISSASIKTLARNWVQNPDIRKDVL